MATTSDPKLRAWWIAQLQAHDDAIGGRASTANRSRRAAEAAAQGDVLPSHIQRLIDAVANSEAPLRPEVRAEVEAEIQRRIAARKENGNA